MYEKQQYHTFAANSDEMVFFSTVYAMSQLFMLVGTTTELNVVMSAFQGGDQFLTEFK